MFFYSSDFQTIDFDQLVGLKINGLCPALFLNETEEKISECMGAQ